MAEGVVVVLEAVEIEDCEHDRRLGRGLLHRVVERPRQRAAVAQSGQGVGERLVAGRAQHADVLAEGQRQPDHHEHQRRGGETDGEEVEVAERAVDKQLERDGAGGQRRRDQPQRVGAGAGATRRRRLPGGEGDQEEPGPPSGVEPAARDVRALGHLDEIHRVREPEQQDPAGEQRPGAIQAPAGAGDGSDADRQQEEVRDRVGEARRDRDRVA
jgi:hypothetical protein